MKKIILIMSIFFVTATIATEKTNNNECKSVLSKLKPKCIKLFNNPDGIFTGVNNKLKDNFEKNKNQ